jgi:flagellin-like protein
MRKNKALSEVVSTLIMLVVAVLLAAVATYYATNITMTRTQNEEVSLSKAHIWVNGTGAVGAFKLQNLGGKDILIDKISVRGVEEAWADVFTYRVASGSSVDEDLNVTSYINLTGSPTIDGRVYTAASADIPLSSGAELLVYIAGPDNVQLDDIGTAISMSIYTNNANFITEVNVESATSN